MLRTARSPANTPEAQGAPDPARPLELFCWVLLFLSGGLALVYEILWMRQFAAIFGATAPATAATLAAVFVGFTVGSLVLGSWTARVQRPLLAYGAAEIGAGLGALPVGPLLCSYAHF